MSRTLCKASITQGIDYCDAPHVRRRAKIAPYSLCSRPARNMRKAADSAVRNAGSAASRATGTPRPASGLPVVAELRPPDHRVAGPVGRHHVPDRRVPDVAPCCSHPGNSAASERRGREMRSHGWAGHDCGGVACETGLTGLAAGTFGGPLCLVAVLAVPASAVPAGGLRGRRRTARRNTASRRRTARRGRSRRSASIHRPILVDRFRFDSCTRSFPG